jgi:hypothetical protein
MAGAAATALASKRSRSVVRPLCAVSSSAPMPLKMGGDSGVRLRRQACAPPGDEERAQVAPVSALLAFGFFWLLAFRLGHEVTEHGCD